MKVISYRHGGQDRYGVLTDNGVIDVSARWPQRRDLRQVLREDALPQLERLVAGASPDCAAADIEYLPVIPNPEKIICIGVNYAKRNAEYKDGSKPPRYPSVFMRSRESLTGHEQPILVPPESNQLDYEGEIVMVIGRAGRRIAAADAHRYVAGTTIMNEGSVRDWLRHAKFNVTQGKNFFHSGAVGPALVTADEVDPMDELRIRTHVNGELRQDDTTLNLMFPFANLVAYLSTFYQLKPGDLIATGTPNGAGARFDPPRYLSPGDEVAITVPGVGELINTVKAESPT